MILPDPASIRRCPKHPDAEINVHEQSGDLTPTWVAQCDECAREVATSGDGKQVRW